ncbi:TetR/AcrR family transcriptional regulator [Martelella endophytica]|uniref:HTH tetR-type domain-containing protein n=1 Tax=Martelella endophytica TaxID=1486262 RepID=A0A0D5LSN0_MAREN|nr:TetR family transcriptional regulator [Martelella endophytica]AJY47101.1 hypothetical protein TM49_17770 [Martelella endophytica]
MQTGNKRSYSSPQREQSANKTRDDILDAATLLFSRDGIDATKISAIAERAKVGQSTIYAIFKGKAGLLAAIMERSLFGARFEAARKKLEGETDPVRMLAMTASIARAIYEDEAEKLGLMRGISGFSAELRKQEQRFETIRYEMQRERIEALFRANLQRPGLGEEEARRLLWMYTSRDIYRMLVVESGWSPERYEEWLAGTLVLNLARAR